ncbi:MAG: glycine cleavage system protein GcvH [Planctomycetes bacterium]|nr:glycine cleavage system protein GcvH [Planctomycetota bacterium]
MRPNDRKYLKSHEWCKVDGDTATLGITDFAVSQLSDLVFLDLPKVGSSVTAGEQFGEVESVKAVSSLYSPVTGEVTAVNDDLPDNLQWLGEDAFEKAWMIKVKFTATSPDLLDAGAYEENCKAEE